MDIKEAIEKMPHLKEALSLYEKILIFLDDVSKLYSQSDVWEEVIGCGNISYPEGLIDRILEKISDIFNIPYDSLMPLKEAIKLRGVDIIKFPLNELPPFSLPYNEKELKAILFLIAKPYFMRLKDSFKVSELFWEDGRCPVCRAIPSITTVDENGKRRLYCSFCGSIGSFKRLGCPVCLNNDSSMINIISLEGEDGFRADVCEACGFYVKTIILPYVNNELADLISLPLDIVVQSKGYKRSSPNPLGMTKV